MLFHIILTPADRERLGAPAALPYDHGTMLVSEATALYRRAGLNRQSLIQALIDGDPEGRKAVTWLALRRARIEVPYSELDFDVVGWSLIKQDADEDTEPEGNEGEGNSGAPETGGQTQQP